MDIERFAWLVIDYQNGFPLPPDLKYDVPYSDWYMHIIYINSIWLKNAMDVCLPQRLPSHLPHFLGHSCSVEGTTWMEDDGTSVSVFCWLSLRKHVLNNLSPVPKSEI